VGIAIALADVMPPAERAPVHLEIDALHVVHASGYLSGEPGRLKLLLAQAHPGFPTLLVRQLHRRQVPQGCMHHRQTLCSHQTAP